MTYNKAQVTELLKEELNMWKKGTLKIETEDGVTTIWYEAKVYDKGSIYGIDEGRISKLELVDDETGFCLASYDRGWGIEPCNDAARAAVAELLDMFYWAK